MDNYSVTASVHAYGFMAVLTNRNNNRQTKLSILANQPAN